MIERKQCCYMCSLKTGTLILLWIVMICCGFHMLFANHNQQSVTPDDNESIINAKNSAVGDKTFRQKRSIRDTFNNVVKEGKQVIEKTGEQVVNTLNQGSKLVTDTADNIGNTANKLGQIVADPTKITDELIRHITKVVINEIEEDRVVNKFSIEVMDLVFDELNKRLDTTLDKFNAGFHPFFKNFIHYLISIYTMLGITSSAIGIIGIHRNISEFLTFSVHFFHLSAVCQFLVMSEINIDTSIERKRYLLSEVTGIDWTDFMGDSLTLVNFGFFCFIGLLLYFAYMVKKCRNLMLKSAMKKTDSNNEDNASDTRFTKYKTVPFY